MRASSLLVVGLVGFAAGCDGNGVNIDASAETVCEEVAEVACHNMYNCCTEGEIESFLGVGEPRSQEQCEDDVHRACQRQLASIQDSLAEGRVRFEPNAMNACLTALAAPDGTCAEVVPEVPWAEACMATAWVGIVPLEGECFFSFECLGTPDAFCAPNQRCMPRSGFGEPCGAGCASDLFCNEDNLCSPRLGENIECDGTNECQRDLFCDFNATLPVCTRPGPAGTPCRTSSACESGQCIPGTCSGTFGDTCFEDSDCNGSCADDGSFCTDNGDCSIGMCELSGFTCSSPTSCPSGDNCVFPVQCIPSECVGDPVCTEPRIVIDYCEDAVSSLPGV